MADIFSDSEIDGLILARKELPANWKARLQRLNSPRGGGYSQERSSLILRDIEEGEFRISLRRNTLNRDDFSVILCFRHQKENRWFRLRRYNGLHVPLGMQRNRIERNKIRGFHIHKATLRYQQRGLDEDGFAEVTDGYKDVYGALNLMLKECGFVEPPPPGSKNPAQRLLFSF